MLVTSISPFIFNIFLTFFIKFQCISHILLFFSTLYHTIMTFSNPKTEGFRKHCGKRRKCWKPAFSPFPTMFPTFPKTNFNFSFTFILSSANAFNLDQSKILSFGKGLSLYQTTKIQIGPN